MEIEQAIEGFELDNALLDGMNEQGTIERNELAITALREKAERENPKPLTLEELKEREAKPVYLVYMNSADYNHWDIYTESDSHDDHEDGEILLFTDIDYEETKDYGKTWLAYDHEPKEAR